MSDDNQQQPATKADLAAAVAELRASQDRAVESIAAEFSQARQEAAARFTAIERRLDRMHETVLHVDAACPA